MVLFLLLINAISLLYSSNKKSVKAADVYRIGTIFNVGSMQYQNLEYAVNYWNMKNADEEISLKIVTANAYLDIIDRVCNILHQNVVAFVLPSTINSSDAQSTIAMCYHFHVPCIILSGNSFFQYENEYVLDIGPSQAWINSAIDELIIDLHWASFLLLYVTRKDLVALNGLISQLPRTSHGFVTMKVRQLPKNDGEYIPFLKSIQKLKETNIILHSDKLSVLFQFLQQASAMNMTNHHYSYIFTNMDLFLLEEFINRANGIFTCNISGLRIVQTNPPMKTELSLTMDAVLVIGKALMNLKKDGINIATQSILCEANNIWTNGEKFKKAIKQVKTNSSATGGIKFDKTGKRSHLVIDGIKHINGEFVKFGNWSQNTGWKYDSSKYKNEWDFQIDPDAETLEGLTLRVVVYVEEPFVIKANNSIGYDGYCIDLLIEMAKILKFNFTIFEGSDGIYGIEDENGRWNGIIGVLQRREADLAVSAVTITYSRSEVIDFTLPFMHLGISILLAKDPVDNDRKYLFTFLKPLSFSVWLSLAGAYLTVSFTMWFLAKFSPYEWYDIEQIDNRNRNMDDQKNQFTILNSLWFAVGSLMQQGSDVIPRAAATRIVAVVWWLFTLIMLSSYTAQLAAFLTVQRMTMPVESTMELAAQQKIKYGTLKNGSTMDFFRESKISIYERMWSIMESTVPSVFVNSSREGIDRVKAGNYAYLMESSMLEYYIERDCQLQRIGGLLDSKGYGIALPKGSPLRHLLSQTVLQLQERTTLVALKNKWWKDKSGLSCSAANEEEKRPLFHNILGIFYVLLAGLIIAMLFAISEYFIESRKESYRLDMTLLGRIRNWWDELLEKWKLEKKRKKLSNLRLDTVNETESPKCFFTTKRRATQLHPHKRKSTLAQDIPQDQLQRLNRLLPMNDERLFKRRISTLSDWSNVPYR